MATRTIGQKMQAKFDLCEVSCTQLTLQSVESNPSSCNNFLLNLAAVFQVVEKPIIERSPTRRHRIVVGEHYLE